MRIWTIALLMAASASAFAGNGPSVFELEPVASGLSQPLAARHAGDGSGRLFIVEQNGAIRILNARGHLLAQSFIDLGPGGLGLTSSSGERGLLGLDFHPDFESNGFFYVNYTDNGGDTVVARYSVSAGDLNLANSGSALVLITIDQDFGNHNGGDIHFGPDGFLYIGMGDGGSGGDPNDRAQDPLSLLGKMLRIDVDNPGANLNIADACGDDNGGPVNYGIPADNPFLGGDGTCDETWALGLRNPFRFSFDRQTGDLFIGDVGQNLWEEVSFQPAASTGGQNYGWDCREGAHDFNNAAPVCTGMSPPVVVDPILEYFHELGRCSIAGGYRYRGGYDIATGLYFYGDFCTGELFTASETSPGVWSGNPLPTPIPTTEGNFVSLSLSAFGEDELGNLYVVDRNGTVYRFGEQVFAGSFE